MTSTPTRPVDNVVIATKGLQDRNINIPAGTTVENKGKFIILSLLLLSIIFSDFCGSEPLLELVAITSEENPSSPIYQ